jgi:GNAT superfamily N-acetyltransferase
MTFNYGLTDHTSHGTEHDERSAPISRVNYFLREKNGLVISTDPGALDVEAVFTFLAQAKWWTELTRESLERALSHSLCFSLKEGDRQIGFARVITDFVTHAYLCDVYIVAERRGKGLGSWLIHSALEHPHLENLKRVALITHDAQDFYLGLDFRFLPNCRCYMERLQ